MVGEPNHPSEAEAQTQPDTGSSSLDLDAGLALLGYEGFRPGQREAIETLLEHNRMLLVAPTGGGKSLTYQLPAALLPGTTLIISPLVSLMLDQVDALSERGIAATYLAATLGADELKTRMRELGQRRFKIVYVAPERLAFAGFRSLLRSLDCPLIAVDEAHCIAEWGHDFRPEYMRIGAMISEFPEARVLACTATATPIVRDEILARLGLDADAPQLIHGFARPNLALRVAEVRSRRDREKRLDLALAEMLGEPGAGRGTAIVYSPTRKLSEEEAARLAKVGWKAVAYHAGLSGERRDKAQREFLEGRADIVVATNAFGMGIDRADVRLVAHLAPPGSVEAYYQEVGRAGRDGEDAVGLLAIASGDMPMRRHLIEMDVDGRTPDPEQVRHRWNLFLELMRWAEGGSCRHDAILRYFGDEEETLAGCGRCDNCTSLDDGSGADPEETALIVRKALSAVARIHGRFGLQAAAKLLRGTDDPRLSAAGLTDTKTFGILSDRSDDWLVRLLRRCVTAGWVDFHGGDRPVVILTEEGAAVMQDKHPARILLPSERSATDKLATGSRVRAKSTISYDDLDESGRNLFEALRKYRLNLARSQSVAPYVIASDRALRDIALLKPRTLDELGLAHGIGPSKAQKYGRGLLEVVSDHL
jgi:ATP-dependent DNA helicase RecQ